MKNKINICDFGADSSGNKNSTKAIQRVIDKASIEKKSVFFPTGVYLVGALFLKNDSHLVFENGSKLVGSTDINDYPEVLARVAGVEMFWPSAIINGIGVKNITISGQGVIDGQGEHWWNLYWGSDKKSGQRKIFDEKGLRWIADYAIKRPREILFQNSERITIRDITLQYSGFWNLQITYCNIVLIEEISIKNNKGPSTDGIDIDSSSNIKISKCTLACGDDCIAIKSGRDGDGYKINRPSEKIEIDNCKILSGYGITIGSEVSGNIRDVNIHDIIFENSQCGFRMKSAKERGGIIENINVSNLFMRNVQFPFSWIMDWHNDYNRKKIDDFEKLPKSWQKVAEEISENMQMTLVKNILIKNIEAIEDEEQNINSRAFDLVAFRDKPMVNITFKDCVIHSKEFGRIVSVNNLNFDNVVVDISSVNNEENNNFDNR